MSNGNQVQIYQSADGQASLKVTLEKDTVWLSQEQMAELFGTKRPAITKHLGNIYKAAELDENSTCSILEHMAEHGQSYKTRLYNLDAIISVGYRVNSSRATQFRIWATNTLKQHLVAGYTLNQRRLQERGIQFEQALSLLSQTLANGNKRTGAFLFLWYLRINQDLLAKPVEQLINDNTLVALALLVAESKPAQKELMIRLVEHFILLKSEA